MDNEYQLSKAWKELNESWNRKQQQPVHPPKGPERTPGKQVHKPKSGKGSYNRKVWKKDYTDVEESAGAAAGTGGPMAPAQTGGTTGSKGVAVFAKKLGMPESRKQKIVKEIFDIASLGATAAMDAPEAPEAPGMGMDTESPAVSDIIAGIQARYPGAIIEISVTAPDGHRFSDEDINCATEVANASNVPDELGGAWAKTDEEGEEGEVEDDTKPLNESYPPSFGKDDKEEAGEDEGKEEAGSEKEEADEDEGKEEKADKPSFGGKEEGEEAEEGGIESCAGVSQDCISLAPEEWSAFLVKADQGCGEEEVGEVDPNQPADDNGSAMIDPRA